MFNASEAVLSTPPTCVETEPPGNAAANAVSIILKRLFIKNLVAVGEALGSSV
jgi:hypothetical protein